MIHKRFIFVSCLWAFALAIANAGPVHGQDLNFKVENYVTTDLNTIRASIDKAGLAARAFVANPDHKPAEHLGADFYKKIVQKPYPLSGGGKLTIEKMGTAGPIVPAMIFATAMREVEKAEMDDGKLQTAWLAKQAELLKAMNGKPTAQNPNPIFQVREEQTWRQFLLEWMQAATEKGSLRKGLQEASYELVRAMVERFDGEIESAQAGPGTSASDASYGSGGTVSSGGYYPLHERLMNHIYHHNDRRMNKVEPHSGTSLTVLLMKLRHKGRIRMDHRTPLIDKLTDFLARATNANDKAAPGGLLPKIADVLVGRGDAGAKTEITGILRDLFSFNQLDLPLEAIKEGDFKQEFATRAGDVLNLILAGAGSPGLAIASKAAIKILKSRIEACGADKNSSVVRGLPVKPDNHGQDVILYYVEDKNGIPILPKVDGSEMLALGILQTGFQNWASKLNLVANMVTKQEDANLIVSGAEMGQNTTILARTEIGPPKGRQLRMVFNLSKPFTSDEFESNVTHEFGHALGVVHEDVVQDGTQVMNSQLLGVTQPQGPGDDTDLGAAIFKGWRPA